MIVFDLTFAVDTEVELLATQIYERFGRSFEPRYSDYLGGDYYVSSGDPEIIVHRNLDGNDVAEADFEDYRVLLQVNGCLDKNVWQYWTMGIGGVFVRDCQYEKS